MLQWLVMMLPDVPHDFDSDPDKDMNIFKEDIDEKIKQRLIKLKFFSQTWTQDSSLVLGVENKASNTSEASTSISEPFHCTETLPVVSTEEERQEFND